MTRTMYDSTNVNDLPANGDLYAGYVAGSYKNYDQVKARFPNKPVVSITPRRFNADNTWIIADVLDIETGNSSPAQGPSWVKAMRDKGRTPTIYCPASLWSACRKAFTDLGLQEPLWWIAKYDNKPELMAGAIAKQYGGNVAGHYDVSIVADFWPGVDQTNNYVGDDLLMSAAKNDDDARRCLIRQWFNTYLGRGFTGAAEQNLHLLNFQNVGADLELAGIMDSPEAKQYRSRTPGAR